MMKRSNKVLIVDDDMSIRLLARASLEKSNFEVQDVCSGEEAVAWLDHTIPDLVLLDVMMPGMDGFETCQAIRNHTAGADIPVLMMTGFDDLATIARTYQVGGTDFIPKPIQWLVLPYRVSFLIRSSRTTRELKEREQELLAARDAAEAANAAKSDFLATMSHEIRTPLGALTGNLELLAGTSLVPQQLEYLHDCSTSSKILLQVINDVLDYSKIEAGKLELAEAPFSIAALGRQLTRIFAPTASQKGLELTLKLSDNLPDYICGDQLRISQIITNLLSNAIKFTHKGFVSLEISCERSLAYPERSCPFINIFVRDTGIGITVEYQEKIFESFSQLERFGTRHFSGTGLGLSICRRLAEAMGGSVSISSIPEQGSVFQVSLPAVICNAPELPEDQHDYEHAYTPRTILLADDDYLGRTVMTSLLQTKGHRVTAVENGSQLLDRLSGDTFNIVLTDISMPDIDGVKVARIIRSGERSGINPLIPIIAMTAHAFSNDRETFLTAGIDCIASKPVDVESLLQQIETICSKQKSG